MFECEICILVYIQNMINKENRASMNKKEKAKSMLDFSLYTCI